MEACDTLAVIDIQEKLQYAHKEVNLQACKSLVDAFQKFDFPIVVAEQTPEKLGQTLPAYAPNGAKKIVRSVFAVPLPPIHGWYVICGAETHICVWHTVRDLLAQDQKVIIITDAVYSKYAKDTVAALNEVRRQFPQVRLLTCEMYLYEILKSPKHPAFKDILTIIKTYRQCRDAHHENTEASGA